MKLTLLKSEAEALLSRLYKNPLECDVNIEITPDDPPRVDCVGVIEALHSYKREEKIHAITLLQRGFAVNGVTLGYATALAIVDLVPHMSVPPCDETATPSESPT